MDGEGTYTYAESDTGYKLVGTFKDGNPNGTCKYYTDSSTSYETEWEDGKCVKLTE